MLRLVVALLVWFGAIAYAIHDAYHPLVPCDTDSECMRLNGGNGDPE